VQVFRSAVATGQSHWPQDLEPAICPEQTVALSSSGGADSSRQARLAVLAPLVPAGLAHAARAYLDKTTVAQTGSLPYRGLL